MNDTKALQIISAQLCASAAKISGLAKSIEDLRESNPEICEDYEHFLLDEVAHIQIITLQLTSLAAEDEEEEGNADDSAFMAGELNSVIGDKDKEEEE